MSIFSETIALLIRADTAGAIGPLKNLEGQAARTATAWDRAGKKIGVSGATLKSGLAAMAAQVSVDAVVSGLVTVTQNFADTAKAAGDLATATGSTVEEVSRMQAALADAGVSAEQSAAMLTKFTTAAGTKKGADTLHALNVELVRGQSGAVDYAATMTTAVDQIMALGDAAQRNVALVALFGRQGAAAFQDMAASGMSLAEAQRAIATGRIVTGEDYQNALKFDDAMDSLDATTGQLANTLGRSFLPVLTDTVQGIGVLADVVAKIPKPILDIGLGGGLLPLLGKLFGDDAAAAKDLKENIPTTEMQALTAVIASGVTSGDAFADAVARAGDELAAQDANARLAAQALDIYRASTDQAYESTLKLLSLDRSERSAQRAAEGAADAAGDAKANLDKALADAKAAQTVVEHIAAIRGRERAKNEKEGIVPGSTDVSATAGVKGRRAQTRTQVTEAAGVITEAEARKIREATRTYEESLDDIAAAWENLAEVRIKHKEALGIQLTEVEKLGEVRDALKEGLQVPGLSPKSKETIKADLAVVEGQIKRLGGTPIELDGIRFKGGTTQKQVDALQKQIADALDKGNAPLAHQLQSQLDALVEGPQKDLNVTLGIDPTSLTATQAALANLGIDPKTGKRYTAETLATADTAGAKKDLDALTAPRTVEITIDVVGVTGSGDVDWAHVLDPQPSLTARGNRINFGGAPAVSFNPTIVNNYPKPERASDSIASSLRTAKYLVGI